MDGPSGLSGRRKSPCGHGPDNRFGPKGILWVHKWLRNIFIDHPKATSGVWSLCTPKYENDTKAQKYFKGSKKYQRTKRLDVEGPNRCKRSQSPLSYLFVRMYPSGWYLERWPIDIHWHVLCPVGRLTAVHQLTAWLRGAYATAYDSAASAIAYTMRKS